MKSSRWDLLVGLAASCVAIAGLGLSIAVGNTTAIGFGNIRRETQEALGLLAGIFLILIAIKAGLRSQISCQAFRGRIDGLLKRPSRRG
jgi:hypothetical protein